MGINKIKLKQIDANFSGLVGEYGSGYFPSISSFNTVSGNVNTVSGNVNTLSGITVKYTDINPTRFVLPTGNQTISGIKTFIDVPRVGGGAGSGVLYSGQINPVYSDFITAMLPLDRYPTLGLGPTPGFKNLEFSNSFTYNPQSARLTAPNFVGRLIGTADNSINSSGVFTSGNTNLNTQMYPTFAVATGSGFQILNVNSNLSYNPNSGILTSQTFSGNLSGNAASATNATNATNAAGVSLTQDNTNGNYFLAFSKTTNATANSLFIDPTTTPLTYNPSTHTVVATTFSGNATSANTATVANNVALTADDTNTTCYIAFSKTTGGVGVSNALFIDPTTTPLTYNPSSSVLIASTFRGSISGNALNAASAGALNIGTFASTDSINFNFPAGTSNYIMTSGAFYATPTVATNTTARNLGLATNGWNNLYVRAAPILTSDRNLKTEISEIPDSWLDAWEEVNYVKYKFKDAVAQKGVSGARWHLGHIAQDIYEAFNKYNLNAFDIGMLCYDKWDQSVDPDGNVIPSGEIWSIRPDECQFMELALMRRSLNRLRSGISI